MAPFVGPNKKDVIIKLYRHWLGPIEITLGLGSPKYFLRYSGGRYELLPLVLNAEKAEQSARKRQAEGYYQPEMDWQHLVLGAPIIQETSKKIFISKLESWPGWTEVQQT